MKKDIHPKYFTNAVVNCNCGAEFKIAGIKENLKVEICSQCHPFYTGKDRLIDAEGRVEKFKKKFNL